MTNLKGEAFRCHVLRGPYGLRESHSYLWTYLKFKIRRLLKIKTKYD
jgi:hypothetical protein